MPHSLFDNKSNNNFHMKILLTNLISCVFILAFSACGPMWSETQKEGFNLVKNEGGATLGYHPESGGHFDPQSPAQKIHHWSVLTG